MAEEKRVGQSEQKGQNNIGTRGSRDAGGGRSQRVKGGKGESSTEGQKGIGEQGEREAPTYEVDHKGRSIPQAPLPTLNGDDRSLKYEIGCLLDERFQFREGTVRPKIMSSISAPRPERRVKLRKRKM